MCVVCRVHDNVIAILCQSGDMESWPAAVSCHKLCTTETKLCNPSKVSAGMSPVRYSLRLRAGPTVHYRNSGRLFLMDSGAFLEASIGKINVSKCQDHTE